MTTEVRLADGSTPVVGSIVAVPKQHATHVFYRIVKVNRKSIVVRSMTALSALDEDGSFVGIDTRCPYGTLHVIAGDDFGDEFKSVLSHAVLWDGQPVEAQRIEVASFSNNTVWKKW